MSRMKDLNIAVEEFADRFSDSWLTRNVAPVFTYNEMDALASLLEASGRSEAGKAWRDAHEGT